MSNPLPLIVTDPGRAALVNADNDGTAPVLVSHIGVTDQAFTATASTAAVPGELKQLTTFSGQVTADNIIHVIIRDDSADTYSLRGIGLYLDDGTLFASYGQADVIMEKSAAATLLLATDTIFADIDATNLTFGDTNFLNPAATPEVQGVVELADDTEAKAGTDGARAMTPIATTVALDHRFGAGAPSNFVKSLLTKASAAALWLALGIKSAAGYDTGEGKGLDADKLDGQHGAYYRRWDKLTGVPQTFPPSSHTHTWSQVTDKPAEATRWAKWGEVTGKPASFPPSAHSHAMNDINGLGTALAGKMPKTWTVTAGAGLTGGGSGSASRTLRLGTPSTITGSTANGASGDTHTHELDTGTGADQIPRNKDLGSAAKHSEDDFASSTSPTVSGPVTITGSTSYGDTVIDPDSTYERIKLSPWSSVVGNASNVGFYDIEGGKYLFRVSRETGAATVKSSLTVEGPIVSEAGNGSVVTASNGYSISATAVSFGISDDDGNWIFRTSVGGDYFDFYSNTVKAAGFESSGSSRAVKHDIQPIRYGLEEALRLPWVEYRYDNCITKSERLRFGSAVEAGDGMEGVEDVTPLLVRRPADAVPTLDYTEFVPVIGRALQEYVERTDATMARLEARIADLEAER